VAEGASSCIQEEGGRRHRGIEAKRGRKRAMLRGYEEEREDLGKTLTQFILLASLKR
jgi:hypothetical protein